MWVWRETREKWLLAAALTVLGLIILINLQLEVWPWLKGGKVAAFLSAEATGSVSSDLLVGLFSAYIFYLIVELVPKNRRETLTLHPLNLIAASVIHAYERSSIFGHETPITSIDSTVLDVENLKLLKSGMLEQKNIISLKSAMETAHSRLPDFHHALSMAASISPEHALDWLVLTDKIRLLAEELNTWPISPFVNSPGGIPSLQERLDPAWLEAQAAHQFEIVKMTGGLKLRVMEAIEATTLWMERQA
ncbi:hypothetical protein [Pseudomonas lurida]|uniref:hypothetical protein n=1 Tax=Pseudomonas lurida TaxID=244566 RepID=UPI0027371B47|nr:hypothetical protein [Pseudomonas lurida]WLG30169.1 hypothetical protein PSH68_08250 [Pseudomonas lurida]